jgi:hypothetical protein
MSPPTRRGTAHAQIGLSTGSASSSSDASSAVTCVTPFDSSTYASPIWNTPSHTSTIQSLGVASVIGHAHGRQMTNAQRLPMTTVLSVAAGSRLPTQRRPITVNAQTTPLRVAMTLPANGLGAVRAAGCSPTKKRASPLAIASMKTTSAARTRSRSAQGAMSRM